MYDDLLLRLVVGSSRWTEPLKNWRVKGLKSMVEEEES